MGDRLAADLKKSLVQLFSREGPDWRPKPIGSGVLVRMANSVCIFSAAHVIAEFKNRSIWIAQASEVGELRLLNGPMPVQFTGDPAMGLHQTDPIDAAVAMLPDGDAQHLILDAIPYSEFDPATPTQHSHYLLAGLAANRTNVNRRNHDIVTEFKPLILSEVEGSIYEKMGYEKRNHLLLKWNSRWKSVAGRHAARNLAGSSGGGIWGIDPLHADRPPQLVATFTEVPHRHGRKVFVGTRTRVHKNLWLAIVNAVRSGT